MGCNCTFYVGTLHYNFIHYEFWPYLIFLLGQPDGEYQLLHSDIFPSFQVGYFSGDSRSWESREKADSVWRLFILILLR